MEVGQGPKSWGYSAKEKKIVMARKRNYKGHANVMFLDVIHRPVFI
jgi:hypothetical protein